jgi:hypothetical protein
MNDEEKFGSRKPNGQITNHKPQTIYKKNIDQKTNHGTFMDIHFFSLVTIEISNDFL